MNRVSAILLTTLFLGGCAAHAVTSGGVAVRDDRVVPAAGRFSERDRALIAEYYAAVRAKRVASRPAKHEATPPGVARGAMLPAGVKRQSLPQELEARLGPTPPDDVRLIVVRDVVLMNRKTHIVRDILYDVVE